MASKTIQGKYLLFAKIADASHQFANNDRNANFGISGSQAYLNLYALGEPSEASGRLFFNVENKVTIKRIKINPDGASELQKAPLHYAAEFDLQAAYEDTGTFYAYDEVHLRLPNWGTWYDVNITLEPYKRKDPLNQDAEYVTLSINPATCAFYCDDYNLQAAYIGESVVPSLEFEIETAGVTAQSNGWVF